MNWMAFTFYSLFSIKRMEKINIGTQISIIKKYFKESQILNNRKLSKYDKQKESEIM